MKILSLTKPALLILLIGASFSMPLQAQETKNVTINNFTGVSVSVGINLFLTQGSTESAKIVAKEEVIDEVIVEQNGDQVRVHWKENKNQTAKSKSKTAKVYITYKTLTSMSASTGSSIVTENNLKTDKMQAKVSTGASINAKIDCSSLELSTSTGANASFSGTATNMDLKSSTGSNIDALNLVSAYAKVKVSTGANAKVNVTKGLETITSTGGNIRYRGNAAVTSSKKSNVSHID